MLSLDCASGETRSVINESIVSVYSNYIRLQLVFQKIYSNLKVGLSVKFFEMFIEVGGGIGRNYQNEGTMYLLCTISEKKMLKR